MAEQNEGHPGWWDMKRTNEHAARQTPPAANEAPHFVAPSSYLRPSVSSKQSTGSQSAANVAAIEKEHVEALHKIREFLKLRTSYDVLPLSYRLIILDSRLLIKKSLNIMTQNAIVSAPLWDSQKSTFAGLLTVSDYINVIQYYWQNPDSLSQVDQFRLDSLREIEKAIGVPPIETVSIHPLRPLYEAMRKMVTSRARRIPIVDDDDETERGQVVSVITQYRILKFVAVNVAATQKLRKPLRDLKIGTRQGLKTCKMDTPVMDVIHEMSKTSISSVPILDDTATASFHSRPVPEPNILHLAQINALVSVLMDLLVIPGRVRYPSDRPVDDGNSGSVDGQIARSLLDLDGQASSRHVSSHSTVLSYASIQRDTTGFVERYNEIAKRYGLAELDALRELSELVDLSENLLTDEEVVHKGTHSEALKPPASPKRGLWRRIVRSSSSYQLPPVPQLVRKNSLSNLLGRQARLTLKCQSLDDFYQYGGVSVLNLAPPYRAASLAIPSCLAATGNYLIQHGQTSVVQSLYHHYVARIQEAEYAHEDVHANIGSIHLPAEIPCGIHDVASAFKKFLWDLPGGILGSLELFRALRDVQSKKDCLDIQPRLCALAILSLVSTRRIAIVSAVFGLLATIKLDPDQTQGSPLTPTRILGPESMSSRALGVIFAPILLGGLNDHIALQGYGQPDPIPVQHVKHDTPRRGFKNAFRTPKHRKSYSIDRTPEINAEIERNAASSALIEMLLRQWEDIAAQMRMLNNKLGSQRSSRSSSRLISQMPLPKHHSVFDVCMSRGSSSEVSHHHLQVPNVLRSSSFLHPQSTKRLTTEPEDGFAVEMQDVRLNSQASPANLTSHTAQSGSTQPSKNVESIEIAPWWTRKTSNSSTLKENSATTLGAISRVASDPLMLYNLPTMQPDGNVDLDSAVNDVSSTSASQPLERDDGSLKGLNTLGYAEDEKRIPPESSHIFVANGQSNEQSIHSGKVGGKSLLLSSERRDSGVELCDRAAFYRPGEWTSQLESEYLLAPPSIELRTCSSSSSFSSQISPGNKILSTKDAGESCKQVDETACPTTNKHHQAVRRMAQKIDKDATPIRISPSLIPRPVADPGRSRSSVNGSPRRRNPCHAKPRNGTRTAHNLLRRPHRPNAGKSERLQPMYPRQAGEHQDARDPIVRSEPLPRFKDHVSTHALGLRGEPVARQLHFHSPAGRNDYNKVTESDLSISRQQPLKHRGSSNVGTLYAEIRMLSEKLGQARRECAEWQQRAQWAEAALFGDENHEQQQYGYQY
ncbi:hypothetical protein FH972_022770 [Carpinus fangiana]|uniref:CBS domain-containing protein n=1 Tax=Carpinus fangiana TaxID=176857 RepID=A0A5N6KTJ0_9ROSI|nr:hypothetical protein FH972_022770 [Carpinus fangiana]